MNAFEATTTQREFMFHLNHTPTDFIIEGISDVPELQVLIFLLVLLIYLATLGGNVAIVLLVCLNSHLQVPMYTFLANLSILDMSCSTAALHKIFTMSLSKEISYLSCLAQLYIFSSLTSDQFWILVAMSYDRYVAICKPLYYHMVMNGRHCALLVSVCWVLGFLEVVPHITTLSRFTCYRSNKIDHFFCDVLPIREITCSDTTSLDLCLVIIGLTHLTSTFTLTLIPYVFIISSILNIKSNTGRQKAFYTCSSHIAVVLIFYMTIIIQYIASKSTKSNASNKVFALLNTAIVPMLNPLIYSLKNKDVKLALKRMIKN
ncbi:olfactory receptor 6C3-like [Rana temporaria]|uniref:olfactory receptor 6C3-like n=1 Tax=Rana temporaria TaxID=8407 RepID=UPI001AACAA7D|nr:olfactory receptor 6C3-like [Rana temporaria]